jgi:hypothetical protein
MNEGIYLRVNSPKVIHEIIDGEAVIVNLDSGNYYSLDRVGAEVWAHIEKGAPLHEIIEDISHRYEGEQKEIEKAIYHLVNEMQQENLIIMDESEKSESETEFGTQDKTEPRKERQSFEAPVLYKYNDMQDLLLLDPIHEVDETGWPNVKQDNV